MRRYFAAVLIALAFLFAPPVPATEPGPISGFVTSADGTRLNYLDWGGRGPAIVMIHGFGDDPHVFDAIARDLRNRFHIVAYARRGHGKSDAPLDRPYDLPTYVADMRAVFDGLHIDHASLIGWSMGGNEITAFAGAYPARVDKLIYLEAGYDWSDVFKRLLETLAAIEPSTHDLKSLNAYARWWRKTSYGSDKPWYPEIDDYLRDSVQIAKDGSVAPLPTPAVEDKILPSLRSKRDYASVQAPVLAIYADRFLPVIPGDAAYNTKDAVFESHMDKFRTMSIARIQREIPHASICRLRGRTHMSIGFEKHQILAANIGAYLDAPSATHFQCNGT